MRKLVALALLAACSKSAPPAETPSAKAPAPEGKVAVVQGDMAKSENPVNLPPPGTAPPTVAVGKQLDEIWTTPIKTLKGQPTTLAAYKGKALMLVNVASKCGNTPQYTALEALQKK